MARPTEAARAARPVLSADVYARAIIAAARIYGDDPERPFTHPQETKSRRALTAAVSGIVRELGLEAAPVAAVLGVGRSTVFTARCKNAPGFAEAETAVRRAVSYAHWRPEARASVVAGTGEEALPSLAELGVEADDLQALLERDGVAPPLGLMAQPAPAAEPAKPEPVKAAAEANAVRTRPPGRSEALFARDFRNPPTVAQADRPTGELLLEVLAEGEPLNTMSLAYRIDRKEMTVTGSLKVLEHQGLVQAEPVTGGPRAFVWRLAEAAQ